MSEAKIRITGQIKGTAWLVHEQHAITAAHCVGAVGSALELLFEDPATHVYDVLMAAVVQERDAKNDGALLKLQSPKNGTPVLQPSQLHGNFRPRWLARGFPSLAESAVQVVEARGITGGITALVQAGNPHVIQLNLEHASTTPEERIDPVSGQRVHALAGMSGAAVKIAAGPGEGRVIGMVRCSIPLLPQDIIYATPIDQLWPLFAPHIGNPPLQALGRQSGQIVPDPVNPGGVLSSIDADLVNLAWGDSGTITDIYVDYTWDGAEGLRAAVIRLVLHQPKIFRLHVREPALWTMHIRKAAKQWMVLESFQHELLPNQCIALTHAPSDNISTFPNNVVTGQAIQQTCDLWVLAKLNEHLGMLFVAANPRDFSPQFDIAPDVRTEMETTWQLWHPKLAGDPALLHHFLTLLLTEHGDFDATGMPCPGAGPLTLMDCIIRGATFGLAVAPFLPAAFHPKWPHPGNIGADTTHGHVCGIRGLQSTKLEKALRGHAWRTHVVVLRQLDQLPEQWRISSSSFETRSATRRTALNQVAPAALVIPCDEELCDALATNVAAIRALLAARMQELQQAQEEYANNATP